MALISYIDVHRIIEKEIKFSCYCKVYKIESASDNKMKKYADFEKKSVYFIFSLFTFKFLFLKKTYLYRNVKSCQSVSQNPCIYKVSSSFFFYIRKLLKLSTTGFSKRDTNIIFNFFHEGYYIDLLKYKIDTSFLILY